MLFPCFLRKRRVSFEAVVQSYSVKKGLFRNFAKFAGKHLRQSLFFNKVAGLRLLLKSFSLNRRGFLFTYFIWISWNQIKCNEIYIKLCFMKQSERNISHFILAFKEVLLTGPKIQTKIPSPSGVCVLGEGQLYTLHLMVKG